LQDAHPDRKSRKLEIVEKVKMTIKSPLKPVVERTLAPSMGKKHNAKTMMEKAIMGANLKTVRLASFGSMSSFVSSLMRSASG